MSATSLRQIFLHQTEKLPAGYEEVYPAEEVIDEWVEDGGMGTGIALYSR